MFGAEVVSRPPLCALAPFSSGRGSPLVQGAPCVAPVLACVALALGSICIGMGSVPAFAGMPRLFGGGGGDGSICVPAQVRVYGCTRDGVHGCGVYICDHPWVRAGRGSPLASGLALPPPPPSAAGSGRALGGGRYIPFKARSLHRHTAEVCVYRHPPALVHVFPAAAAWAPAELGGPEVGDQFGWGVGAHSPLPRTPYPVGCGTACRWALRNDRARAFL